MVERIRPKPLPREEIEKFLGNHRSIRQFELMMTSVQYLDDDFMSTGILTTRGDLITRNATTNVRLPLGTSGQVLSSDGTDALWSTKSPVISLGGDLAGSVTLTNLTSGTLSATIQDNTVSNAKLRDSVARSVIGNATAVDGDPGDIVFTADGQFLQRAAGVLVTATISSTLITDFNEAAQDAVGGILTDTATIDFTYSDATPSITAAVIDDSITDAKLRNSAALSVIGRSANSTGDPADIVGTASQVLRVNAVGTVLGFGQVSVNGIADDSVTNAKMANMVQATVKGRAEGAGTGDPTDLSPSEIVAIIDGEVVNWSARQQVFGTTTANIALVSGLGDSGTAIHSVEQTRTHRVAAEPFITLIRVNTSYAAPSALVSGNSAGSIAWGGYDGTTIQPQSALMFLDITETWSGTARGGNLRAQTTTTGTTTRADRLILGGNSTGSFAQIPSGVGSQCGLAFISDIDCGLRLIGANHWAAVAGAVDLIDLTTTVATFTGNVSLGTAGNKLLVKEGTNAAMGVATLVLGAVVVNTTLVTANSRIFLTVQALGTVAVATAIAVTARTAGTSFTISSASATDTSVVAWHIVEPA